MTWPIVIGDTTFNEADFADYGWTSNLPRLINTFVTFAQGEVATVKAGDAAASAVLAQQWATKTDAQVSGVDWSAKKYALLASASEAAVAASAATANTKAGEAAGSAIAAAGSASTANTKAGEAAASAVAAAGSASTANTKAGEAAGSANAAAISAGAAAGSASTANTKAGEAAASAIAAAGSASTANTKALEAAASAIAAQEAAASAAGGGIKITSADTAPSLLDAALTVTGAITKAVQNPGGNETLQLGHSTADGALHVPATGTTNSGKVLKAGATAGSASWGWVAYSELTGVPSTFAPSAHSHGNADITGIDASKITSGTIDIARIPQAALERMTIVTNQAARYALTTATVQLGDTCKQSSDGRVFVLVNEAQIGNSAGWEEYTVGSAASVPWSGITDKPTTLAGYAITDAAPSSHVGTGGSAHAAATGSVAGFMAAADKTKLDAIPAAATIATQSYVTGLGYLTSVTAAATYAPLASPSFTGVPSVPTAAAGTSSTQAASCAFVRGELSSGLVGRNRIINGDFRVAQISGSTTVNSATRVWPIDRWSAFGVASAGVYTLSRSIGSGAVGYMLTATVGTTAGSLAAGDSYAVLQRIEGPNVADLGFGAAGAAKVTLSFVVRSSVTGTFSGTLRNGATNRSYPFSYNIPTANTLTPISITIDGDTSGSWSVAPATTGLDVIFCLGAGSSGLAAAGAWATGNYFGATGTTNLLATSGATWSIGNVQLERGAAATGFEFRPYGAELALCQRHLQVYGDGLTPTVLLLGMVETAFSAVYQIPLRVPMAVTPTLAFLAAVADFTMYTPGAAAAGCTAITTLHADTTIAYITATNAAGGLTPGYTSRLGTSSSTTRIIARAEL